MSKYFCQLQAQNVKIFLSAVGFEPTPPERLVPKTSALDHSAKLTRYYYFNQ